MMTAADYRARSAELLRAADASSSYALILDFETLALEWLRLAALADWQTAMVEALARSRDGS